MPEVSDEFGRIPAHGPRPRADKTTRPRSGPDPDLEKPGLTLPKDRVEIGVSKKEGLDSPQGADKVNVRPQDLERYTSMLMDMPDVDDAKVQRVQQILAEDGYDESVLSTVVDRLMEDL